MKNYSELKIIASQLCCGQIIEALDTAEKQDSDNMLHAAFLGSSNSGKTTLINAVAGRKLREASSIIDTDAKPLRLTFERMPEDGRYECFEAYNELWNAESAVLYELSNINAVCGSELAPVMNGIDVVFYLVSATMPFTSEDLTMLDLLKNHKVIPVMTKLDLVDEESRLPVINYAKSRCEMINLPAPIVTDYPELRKTEAALRSALPAWSELEEYRRLHTAAILKDSQSKLKAVLNEKLEAADKKLSEDEEKRKQSFAYNISETLKLKNKYLARGIALAEDYSFPQPKKEELEKFILRSGRENDFSEKWANEVLRRQVEGFLNDCFDDVRTELISGLKADADELKSELGPDTEIGIERIITLIEDKSLNYIGVPVSEINTKVPGFKISKKGLAISASVIAGTLIVPIPTWMTVVLSLGAILSLAGVSGKEREAEIIKAREEAAARYADSTTASFEQQIRPFISDCYAGFSDLVEEAVSASGSSQPDPALIQEKENILSMLSKLGE